MENQLITDSRSHLEPQTFSDFGRIWLESRVDLKPTTRACYRSMLNMVNLEFGELSPKQVSYLQVVSWVATLAEQGVSPTGVRQAYQIVGQVLALANRLGEIESNVAAGVPLPTVCRTGRHRYLSVLQLESLALEIGWWRLTRDLAGVSLPVGWGQNVVFLRKKGRAGYLTRRKSRAGAIDTGLASLGRVRGGQTPARDGNQLEILVRLLGYTGLRIGEALALTPAALDLDRRIMRIERAVSEVSGRQVFGTPKNGRTRVVPIPDFLRRDLRVLTRATRGGDDFLFATKHGTPLRASNLRLHFDMAALAVGQAGLHIHDLRHTAATLAVSAGANVKSVQRMLGHSSASLTLDVYADLFEPDLGDVAGALSRMRQSTLRRAAA
ncbi:tyrosine-type recombinase/integrase [Mobiluncus curtisii]|uniref:tyrosine-type recombinase/integrase n=1 Tax=Mobiluncus curtisii TaxID=2051 RepID=UPI0001E0AD25|nr:site-specific integrase [Mobiluncus curtisii]EFL94099.1 site-specific recombinase, phage integrase family [Mobiluncus curtisii subsp. curtisii ATCC 35241]QQT12845.1 site-specific integrase [Mobiluncus curtisii]STY77577.1 Tyrosine recombinase XerC [Mobiluncus curtisii subsp. curtisii]